jgi:hypothetical protein
MEIQDNNLNQILEEFENYKGQLVLISYNKIERLISIGDDTEDYYYVTWNGKKMETTWNSCVGPIMPLKGYLRDKDYNELVRIAKLNHLDQIQTDPEQVEKLRSHLLWFGENSNPHTLRTDPCWDLH